MPTLEASASVFRRGLPPKEDLQNPAIARIFSKVLSERSTLRSHYKLEDDVVALQKCFRCGWFHADKLDDGSGDLIYVFASPLHRLFVEWKLWNTVTAPMSSTPTVTRLWDTVAAPMSSTSTVTSTLRSTTIFDFAVNVIAEFSPLSISPNRRIGPQCTQRPPEAQYQDEFYRSCYAYSKGSLVTFPEFGTKKGRVDFYIPAMEWGVELLRDGNQLTQHSGRFSQSGSYKTTLPIADYIILDFRDTQPTRQHPSMWIIRTNLYPFFSR